MVSSGAYWACCAGSQGARVFEIAVSVTLAMLTVAALLAFVRVLRGPTLPDRVVAMDLVGVLIVGLIVVYTAASGTKAFLDVAMVIALVSFVGTVAYARYIERDKQP
jgi:multicomponent Na+:H+ antiporter subunit F